MKKQIKVIIHNSNYGTQHPSIISSNHYDTEPSENEILEMITADNGYIAEVEEGYDDNFKTIYTIN